jgi:hypothetical protein
VGTDHGLERVQSEAQLERGARGAASAPAGEGERGHDAKAIKPNHGGGHAEHRLREGDEHQCAHDAHTQGEAPEETAVEQGARACVAAAPAAAPAGGTAGSLAILTSARAGAGAEDLRAEN